MILSRYTLRNVNPETATVPDDELFDLPEKVLQFGTGSLLRGLADFFIDKANRQGLFNGRIVMVKTTAEGDALSFNKQDGMYTLCVRDKRDGKTVEENIITAAISRVLSATEQWNEVLDCAHNSQLQIIISNTSEVGIQLVPEDIRQMPPRSFPGKLLAFLYERFRAFGGSERSGMTVVPMELIPDNGTKLHSIVLELAHLNGLEDEFIEWLESCNRFCNSLADRIVPGRPDAATQAEIEETLGYKDSQLTVAEAYRLWAIEGDEEIKSILSFVQADEGVVVEPNIEQRRELKLRLLNGTHTFTSGLAFLSGCTTVREAMEDKTLSGYIAGVMRHEIMHAIPANVDDAQAQAFAQQVLQRFRNPFMQHPWVNITLNYSAKMKQRCIPLLQQHYRQSQAVPELMALGFAAYLYFMKPVVVKDGKYYGELSGTLYPVMDDMAETFYKRWLTLSPQALVKDVLRDSAFWGTDLFHLNGFAEAVLRNLEKLTSRTVKETIAAALEKTAVAA